MNAGLSEILALSRVEGQTAWRIGFRHDIIVQLVAVDGGGIAAENVRTPVVAVGRWKNSILAAIQGAAPGFRSVEN